MRPKTTTESQPACITAGATACPATASVTVETESQPVTEVKVCE